MNTYLTVNTDTLNEFYPITDAKEKGHKPNGGKWFTKHNELYKSYNSWLDFLFTHQYILHYQNLDMDNLLCSFITLKDDAKIFELDSVEKLDYLISCYPDEVNLFSYEALSKDYDGIEVFLKPFKNIEDEEKANYMALFDVDSLLLFTTEPIKYYKSGRVEITQYGSDTELTFYNILLDSEEKTIGSIKR